MRLDWRVQSGGLCATGWLKQVNSVDLRARPAFCRQCAGLDSSQPDPARLSLSLFDVVKEMESRTKVPRKELPEESETSGERCRCLCGAVSAAVVMVRLAASQEVWGQSDSGQSVQQVGSDTHNCGTRPSAAS